MRLRSLALIVVAITGGSGHPHGAPMRAWPLRARITSVSGTGTPFRAFTLGGTLILHGTTATRRGPADPLKQALSPLARSDTVHAVTPADFPMDLRKGSVVFLADGRDSLRLVVGWNPFGATHPVTATGRRFVVHLVADTVVIDRH